MNMGQIFVMPPDWIPDPLIITNFRRAFTILPFGRYFLNTLTIVIPAVAGTVISSSISAYSFARLRWRGRSLVFAVIMSTLMLPFAVTLIPTFLGWRYIVGLNSYLPLIVPAWFGGGAFNIFLMRQFMLGIPRELEESAHIDGASYAQILSRIILPLSKSAMIVIGLFAFFRTWNEFLGPLIYLSDSRMYTLALGLSQFIGEYSAEWNLLMAASAVVVMPPVILFFFGQKFLMEGISLTGMKG